MASRGRSKVPPRYLGPPESETLFATEPSSFHTLWRSIVDITTKAFALFDTRPTQDLSVAFNELNSNLCKAHGLVYKLTAFPCFGCPSLLRGNSNSKVVGDTEESTQVLVVYYLLRELLKNQLKSISRRRELDVGDEDIMRAYIDAFEKFTGGVNIVKCIFTYVHGTWQKIGLPTEHLLLPTEVLAVQLWSEHILSDVKDRLKLRAENIVASVRSGRDLNIDAMESVKRLSLNLMLLHHSRQDWCKGVTVYHYIIEEPYIRNMVSYYDEKKASIKHRGPVAYLNKCVYAVEKENFLGNCFLGKQSLECVRNVLIKVLIGDETETLSSAAKKWVAEELSRGCPKNRKNLADLYKLLGNDKKVSWMEDVISEVAIENISCYSEALRSNGPLPEARIRATKEVYLKMFKMIRETFGEKPRLFVALLGGLKKGLLRSREPSFAESVAKCLASFSTDSDIVLSESSGNWLATVYSLLDNKETFHCQYIKLLEKRLLKAAYTDRSNSDSLQYEEKVLLDLFHQGKNFDFSCCCHSMLNDVYVRKLDDFYVHGSSTVFRPFVLTQYMWGGLTLPSPDDIGTVPRSINDSITQFMEHYRKTAAGTGRRLAFLPNHSVAVLNMRSSQPRQSSRQLVVLLRQVSVLLAFNEHKELPFSHFQHTARLCETQLLDLVEPCIKAKILQIDASRKTLSVSFPDISVPMRAVVLPNVRIEPGKRHAAEDSRFSSSQPKENSYAVQGLVVKYLKAEGSRGLDEIHEHVCLELDQFSVQRKDVKKALEKLIEREYLYRDEVSKTFKFIP